MPQQSIQKTNLNNRVTWALGYAGIAHEALSLRPHPDTGKTCWALDATIQQYSAFLISLAKQSEAASMLDPIVDSVQIENRPDGDTWFWIKSLDIRP